ncbi:uncharacterized protein [Littorina saxatilis]|uniref:uncharacterized protein n=1 Tax=Littorina saxatilis TaxID=31220 RepID=UPI0038B4DEA1
MTPPETCRLPNIMIERSTSQRRRNSQSPPPKRRIFSTDERRSGSPPSRSGASFSKRSGYGGESFRGDGRRQSPSPGRIGASTESFRSERRSRSPPRRGASTESFRSERRSQSPPRRGTSSESFRSKRRSRSPPRSGASTESFRGERRSQSPPSRSGASFGYGGESFRGDGRRQNQNLTLEQLQPFFGKVFLRFSELKGHLNALDDRLDRLEAAQVHAGQPGPRRQPPPRLPEGQYPVTTVEALVQLDQGLSNDEAMGSAVQYLSAIGGADLKKVIKNIIEKLMCPRLAVSYTLTGRNKDKGKLQDLPHFLDTVYKAAKVRFPEASLVELNSLMGYCLTRNCDRGGQKQEKEEKKKREREEREGEERERNDQQ